ncbi:sarcoplasmic calcium-binding protein [Megachile rotundata]|uniref:sarcoplasmic calcium-binding protein n=1 Tax=Megachile rotundata TaxID=143995 RepID=UPI000258F327|nr:PREDICTED: sarcoplasmic calcium-binding protein [Megachile rotundata]
MATLLQRSLRLAFSNKLLEKSVISALRFEVAPEMRSIVQSSNLRFKYQEIVRCVHNNRNVHQTGVSAFVNEEHESDSESDNEQEKGQSHFWRRKMRTLHSHLDVNKDGVISYDDFMLLGERFCDLGHLSPEAKVEFKKLLNEMWEEQWGEISPYNLVCVEKYLEEMQHVLNDSSLKKKCHHFLPFLFKAVDKDQSGEISVEEFQLFFQCLGLTHDDAIISFSHIDTNDDGKINFEEFITLGREFLITEDPTKPSKYFWGPLVD